jgi:hypothetical protein
VRKPSRSPTRTSIGCVLCRDERDRASIELKNVLRNRDARLLLAGETLSSFGDRALLLALGIWVKTLGAVVLLLFLVHGRQQVWLIYVVAALYGTSQIVFASAQSALLTVMLPREILGEANAMFQTMREALRLVAPLAGAGLFVAIGGGGVAAVDAATFCASAIFLGLLRVPEPRPEKASSKFLPELAAGIRHIRFTVPLRQIVVSVAVVLLVVGFTETLIFAVADQGLHRPPSFVGILLSVQGVGAIVGGLTAPTLLRRFGDGRLAGLGILLFGAGDLFLIVPNLGIVLMGIVIAGTGLPWLIVAFATAIQLRTPQRLQGRVYSAADTAVGTPQTLSIALGAGLSTIVNFRVLFLVIFGVCLMTAVYLLSVRTEWKAPVSPEELAQPTLPGALPGIPLPLSESKAEPTSERTDRPEEPS